MPLDLKSTLTRSYAGIPGWLIAVGGAGAVYFLFLRKASSTATGSGVSGLAGPSGPAGAIGAMGLAGPAGLQGATGDIGATGSTGAMGATGATGATGPGLLGGWAFQAPSDRSKAFWWRWEPGFAARYGLPSAPQFSTGPTGVPAGANATNSWQTWTGSGSPVDQGAGGAGRGNSIGSRAADPHAYFHGSMKALPRYAHFAQGGAGGAEAIHATAHAAGIHPARLQALNPIRHRFIRVA